MAYVNGKSGSVEFGNYYFTWQVNWSETYEIATNTSIVKIESLKIKSSVQTGYWYPHCLIRVNGKTVVSMNYYMGTHRVHVYADGKFYDVVPYDDGVPAPWTSAAITHDTDGSKSVAIEVVPNTTNNVSSVQLLRVDDGTIRDYGKSNGETVALTDIPRFATITTAPNFNDEENPVITYSNPAGNSATSLRACITLDGTVADVEYRDVSKTGNSYTFNLTNAERDLLRAATTDGNSRSVGFYLRTQIGSSVDASKVWRTLTIKNPNPTIDPTITDANSATVALTGDSGKLVRYFSDAHVITDAQAVKKATLTSQRVTCGNKSLNGDGTIEAVESGTFVFTATDSRGNTTQKTITTDFVEYVKLSCILGNSKPDTDGNMTVKVSGSYFDGSFGAVTNSLSVYFRYKVSGGTYGEWLPMNVAIGSSSNYSATATLTGLDYQTQYVFQAYAEDALSTDYSVEKAVKAAPVFDWGESDFKFNVPVYDEVGALIGNGLAAYSGASDGLIDPDTTLESLCLTSHENAPQGVGTFFYIHTVFYHAKADTSNRAQIAFPYKKTGSAYHRYFVSGAWSPWARYMTADEVGAYVLSDGVVSAIAEQAADIMPKIYPPSQTQPSGWKHGDIWLKPAEG